MPKVSFRMASASRESVFGVQTNTARKIHRSDHTEGRLTTAPSGCCVRKGTLNEQFGAGRLAPDWRQAGRALLRPSGPAFRLTRASVPFAGRGAQTFSRRLHGFG